MSLTTAQRRCRYVNAIVALNRRAFPPEWKLSVEVQRNKEGELVFRDEDGEVSVKATFVGDTSSVVTRADMMIGYVTIDEKSFVWADTFEQIARD